MGQFWIPKTTSGASLISRYDIKDFDADGFTLETITINRASVVGWVALNLPPSCQATIVDFLTPTTATNKDSPSVGFRPGVVIGVLNEMRSNLLSSHIDPHASYFGLSAATAAFDAVALVEKTANYYDEDAATTMNAAAEATSNFVDMYDGTSFVTTGTIDLDFDDKFNIDFSAVLNSNVELYHCLVIMDYAVVIDSDVENVVFSRNAEPGVSTPPPPLTSKILEVTGLAAIPISPIPAGLETLKINEQNPDVVSAILVSVAGLSVTSLAVDVPALVAHSVVGLNVTEIGVLLETPVVAPLSSLNMNDIALVVLSPVEQSTASIQITALQAIPTTPILAPLSSALLTMVEPDVVLPVLVGISVLELEPLIPVIPTLIAPGLISAQFNSLTVLIPVTVLPGVASLQFTTIEPDPLTPVLIGLSQIEITDQSLSALLPVPFPLSSLALTPLGVFPVAPIPSGVQGLQLVAQGTSPVAPVSAPVVVVEFSPQVPEVLSSLSLAVQSLKATALAVTVDAFVGNTPGCYRKIRSAVIGRFFTLVEDMFSYEVVHDNQPDEANKDSVWARTRVIFDGASHVMTGDGQVFRKFGRLEVSWFVPVETGWDAALTAADRLSDAFRATKSVDMLYRTPRLYKRGRAGLWWQIDVHIPFLSDDSTTLTPMTSGSAMSFNALHDAINTRFKVEVADAESVYTVYDNFPDAKTDDTEFVRFTVLPGESIQVTTGSPGNNRFRTAGIAVASVYNKVETGDNSNLVLIDKINEAFRAVTAGGVTYRTPRVITVGRLGNWYQTNIEIPFYADTLE